MTGRHRAARSSRGRARPPLTREAVLKAAVAYADERGIEALSMRQLAEVLRVEAMSLYNHVAHKEDLVDGMVDLAIAEIELPTIGEDWKAAMRRRATSAHEMLLRHPWASILIVSRINIGPAMLLYMDATIACLKHAGFSYAMADHAMSALDGQIYGFTLLKANFPIGTAEHAGAARQFLPMIPVETHPHMRALAEEIMAVRHSGINELAFGLDLLLNGLDRLRGGAKARRRPKAKRKQ